MMIEQHNYRDILKVEFHGRKARNKYYSLRAFAQALGISSGALSEIMSGKRNLGLNKANLILEKLKIGEDEKKQFLDSIVASKNKRMQADQNSTMPAERSLTIDLFEIISSPLCMTILAAADLDGFQLNSTWLARNLGEDYSVIEKSLALMRKVELIEETEDGPKISDDFIFCPNEISSRAIKNYHHLMLDKASEALENQAIDKRDISGISFAMNSQDLPQIKKDILSFQKRMVKKYSQGTKNSVYHIESALFELTKEVE